MLETLKAFLIIYSVALIPICLALIWTKLSISPRLSRLLSCNATVWAILMVPMCIFFALVNTTCFGNGFIYGYQSCQFFSANVGQLGDLLLLVTYGFGALYAVVLFTYAAFIEVRNRRP